MAVTAQWCFSIEFRDAKGQTRKVTFCWLGNDTTARAAAGDMAAATAGLIPLLQALSNAHVQSENNFIPATSTDQSGLVYGSTGEYQSVAQQARLYYETVDPAGDPSPVASITIPAPKASIFKADLITVDPANTAIVALNNYIIVPAPVTGGAGACNRAGLQFATFVGGVFVGRKLTRKWNRYTYDPTLTIRGI